jgi:hypothetical protein
MLQKHAIHLFVIVVAHFFVRIGRKVIERVQKFGNGVS